MSKKIKGAVKSVKVIYNPNAGKKRNPIGENPMTLEGIKKLLSQYQIPADYFSTKGPGDATNLAQAARKEKYDTVIAAGGDGTISEVANGLVGTDITLGILPLGSLMNTPKMLSIPVDLERAVMLVKIARTRKIDLGIITELNGEKLDKPMYFVENSSVGIGAETQYLTHNLGKRFYSALITNLISLAEYYRHKVTIVLDKRKIKRRVTTVSISNGRFTGLALNLAPSARLNDHRLTVSVFKMSKLELFLYWLRLVTTGHASSPKVERHQSKRVAIYTRRPKAVHADGQIFGSTPVAYEIYPNAINVITGFPDGQVKALGRRAILDP